MARERFAFLVYLHGDDAVIGRIGFNNIEWDVPAVEIGYWMRTAYSGHGYMTEATAALTAFAFDTLGAIRVMIRCDARNERSAAIARRLGFVHEGTLRCHSRDYITNELTDTMIFTKIRRSKILVGYFSLWLGFFLVSVNRNARRGQYPDAGHRPAWSGSLWSTGYRSTLNLIARPVVAAISMR